MPCPATSEARTLPRACTVVSFASRRRIYFPQRGFMVSICIGSPQWQVPFGLSVSLWIGAPGVLPCRSEPPILPGQVVGASFRESDSIWLNWKRLGLCAHPLQGSKKVRSQVGDLVEGKSGGGLSQVCRH